MILYGDEPSSSGTAGGALHRGWMQLKGAAGADSGFSILEFCEHAANSSLGHYRVALGDDLPPDVRAVVERHAVVAKQVDEQIRDLRDAGRSNS